MMQFNFELCMERFEALSDKGIVSKVSVVTEKKPLLCALSLSPFLEHGILEHRYILLSLSSTVSDSCKFLVLHGSTRRQVVLVTLPSSS